jgi:hypothetical protein
LERSVTADWFASITCLPLSKPPVCDGASVTVRSVPMLDSGLSAVFCARSRPRDRAAMAITSATPIANPSIVRIVRPLRLTNSLRT